MCDKTRIPQARNAILKQGRALGADWIAMTDDDYWVNPSWLRPQPRMRQT